MDANPDISLPLPTHAQEGDEAFILDANYVNFLSRKINAFSNIQAVYPLRIIPSDTNFKLVLVE